MRKLVLITAILAGIMTGAEAQKSAISVTNAGVTGNGLARDTVTNTAVKWWGSSIALPGAQAYVTIQVDITKISGTLGGTIVPTASNNGTGWGIAGAGTYTVLDQTSQTVTLVAPAGFNYYGWRWTGTGTMSGSAVGTVTRR
jgi:hypothetical protein